MYTTLVLLVALLATVLALSRGPLLSQNMNHTFFPRANYKLGNFFHHVPLIEKTCNTGF